MSNNNLNYQWQIVERVAAILEKTLTPSAKVEHNKYLPVIGKPHRRSRQCDIVITYGEIPRQSIAIVEVQKRKSKPDITTFHGWIEKMHEVGAQQLICVSAIGYPESIIDEVATKYGPTVKLCTLEELQEARIQQLIFVAPYVIHKSPNISFESPIDIQIEELSKPFGELDIKPDTKIFSIGDDENTLSLIELIYPLYDKYITELFYEQRIPEPEKYSIKFHVGSNKTVLWIHYGDSKVKVHKLPVRLIVEIHTAEIPLSIHSYRQEEIDDVLAWIVLAEGSVDDKDIRFQIVFKPNKNGFLELTSIQSESIRRLELLFSPSEIELSKLLD